MKIICTPVIDPTPFGLDLDELQSRCTYSEGSFVRLSPCDEEPNRAQSFGQLMRAGKTCRITDLDWGSGDIVLSPMWNTPGQGVMLSASGGAGDPGLVFAHATIDESVTDFVADKVEDRLREGRGRHIHRWMDPIDPDIPEKGLIGGGGTHKP